MAKVLISLVSQQRVPNVLAIKDPFFAEVDRYLFISCDLMESHGVVEHILEATKITTECYTKILIEPESWASIVTSLTDAKLSDSDKYYINITGGTKIMLLAIYSFFSTKDCDVSYFYLPSAKNIIQQISYNKVNKEMPIIFKIGVKEYLVSYGFNLEHGDFFLPANSQYTNLKILNIYRFQKSTPKGTHQFWEVTYILRKIRNKHTSTPVQEVLNLQGLIQYLEIPMETMGYISPREVIYLTGGWFEEWIYQEVKETLKLSDKAIGRNIVINWLGKGSSHGRNELDVVFIYDNTIYIVECKTGLGNRPSDVKGEFTRALNQLAVFSKEMGLRLKMIFITLSNHLREKNGQFKDFYLARANFLDIEILDRENIIPGLRQYLEKLKRHQ